MALLKARHPLLSVALITSALLTSGSAAAQSEILSETEIKAGFLFNFTKFVEWPPDAFPDPRAPVVLGVMGVNPFGKLLTDAAAGKTVNGRAVVVKQLTGEEDLAACQMLFISSSEKKRITQIVEKLIKGRKRIDRE